MRKVIAALQVSVDGFIEGPKGELDKLVQGFGLAPGKISCSKRLKGVGRLCRFQQ
jgi:hypothetical protein